MNSKYIALASASLLLLGAGCLPSPAGIVKNAIENKINNQLGADGSVNLNDNSASFTGDDGTTSTFGENVKLPANFPTDVPVLDGAKIAGVAVTKDQGSWVTMTTDKLPDDVVTWYDDKLTAEGYESSSTYSGSGMVTKSYTKDTSTISFVVTAGENGDPTSVMLTETISN